jgi:tRNA/tmRNA/rRNA uracil-C5-methylase (TrmA/RlmC/RlmD family)
MAGNRTFADILQGYLRDVAPGGRGLAVEPLAYLGYDRELEVKNRALEEFWAQHRLPPAPGPLVPAPRPRHYRTTTRRHAGCSRHGLRLVAHRAAAGAGGTATEDSSRLEPAEHAALYEALAARLREPHFRPLARALSYVIVRGSYSERCVLFNVAHLDGTIVRKLKLLGQALPGLDPAVVSAFAFLDPTRSTYYLDSAPVPGQVKLKRLFGPEVLRVDFAGERYEYYPTGFTQVNEAMVPELLASARRLLAPGGDEEHLVDLYCGYGLFTHYLAASYAHAVGLEAAPEGIAAARRNRRFHPAGAPVSFRLCRIDGGTLVRHLPPADGHREVVLTDPPRQGMPQAAIAALARRRPAAILQACCGIDVVPGQLAAWRAAGYGVRAVRVLDMFAGTLHLEALILLVPEG